MSGVEEQKPRSDVAPAPAVRSLLIPLRRITLMLPHTAVAEVSEPHSPEAVEGAPEWLLGRVAWRGRDLPLIDFEAVSGQGSEGTGYGRLVVCNTLNGDPRLPFIGIASQGIPRLAEVEGSELVAEDEAAAEASGVLAQARWGGDPVTIPDLDALERLLLQQA